MKNKIAIGTVQFGLDYGINNFSGKVKSEEVKKIFQFAAENGINTIDTAEAYGDSENVVGEHTKNISHDWEFISKFTLLQEGEMLTDHFNKSLSKLNTDHLYGYMVHHKSQILGDSKVWDQLMELKRKGLVKKIGYTLDLICELEQLLSENKIPDIIQVPYNILDRRFESQFEKLKELGVEIHTRSSFLQGIFFADTKNSNSYFEPLFPIINALQAKFGKGLADVLLQYPNQCTNIDKIVIGTDNCDQFIENYRSLNVKLDSEQIKWIDELVNSYSLDEQLILPMYWPKNG